MHWRVLSVITILAVVSFAAAQQRAQQPAYKSARLEGTQSPNLNGLWEALTEANWDIEAHSAQPGPAQYGALYAEPAGPGIVEGGPLPYLDSALAQKKENVDKRFVRVNADGDRLEPLDPESKCYMPGLPRANYMPFPFQIIQGTNKIIMAYEFASASRIVNMDKVPPAPAPSYMGWSVGHWDGDTLVVDVTDFNEKTWFDRAGNYHSEDMKLNERYTPAGPDLIQYEATITDPKVYSRPWKMAFPIYRRIDKNAQFLEFKCVPFSEELVYGHLRKQASN